MKELVCYKTTEITVNSNLSFFCQKHSTKEGTWAVLTVHSGSIDFIFLNGDEEALNSHHLSSENNTINVPPSSWHTLSNVSHDFSATLSFYCKRWRYFNKRHKLANVHRDLLSTYNKYKLYERHLEILDIGCGSGRNVLFLAKDNHTVSGFDIKEQAIQNINTIAHTENMHNVTASVHDLNQALSLKLQLYDLIISTVSMQFLDTERVPSLLKELQEATLIDGMHFFVFPLFDPAFTFPETFSYLPHSKELYSFYQDSGWSVLEYNEDVGQLHKRDLTGKPIQGMFATLLAQKIR